MFKYCWYWEKAKGGNFALTGFQPLKVIEDVVVFSFGASTYTKNNTGMTYNPQKVPLAKPYKRDFTKNLARGTDTLIVRGKGIDYAEYTHATPRNLLYSTTDGDGRYHPTQKPVALMEYLIRTYTNESETVLDNTMGSGTTGVACMNTGRKFLGIERDDKYFDIACERIQKANDENSRA
jgi:site-specific DNA-methyltransferase (adenine-specific)